MVRCLFTIALIGLAAPTIAEENTGSEMPKLAPLPKKQQNEGVLLDGVPLGSQEYEQSLPSKRRANDEIYVETTPSSEEATMGSSDGETTDEVRFRRH